MHLACESGKVDALQMAAMVVNVILAALFPIGRDVDSAGELIADCLRGGAHQQILGHLGGIVLGIAEVARDALVGRAGLGKVADRHVVRFGPGADAGGGDAHRAIVSKLRYRLKP